MGSALNIINAINLRHIYMYMSILCAAFIYFRSFLFFYDSMKFKLTLRYILAVPRVPAVPVPRCFEVLKIRALRAAERALHACLPCVYRYMSGPTCTCRHMNQAHVVVCMPLRATPARACAWHVRTAAARQLIPKFSLAYYVSTCST